MQLKHKVMQIKH